MTIMEMLSQSGVISLLGMGFVFLFLAILVVVVSLFGRVFHSENPQKAAMVSAVQTGSGLINGNDAQITAAIATAVNEYQRKE